MYFIKIGKVTLPVAPGKIKWSYKGDNETVKLIKIGEISRLKPMGLTEFSFDALLPHQKYGFAQYENNQFKPPIFYLDVFEKMAKENLPVWMAIVRIAPSGEYLFENSMRVTLDKYEVLEDANEGLDITISLVLKQYKEVGTIKYVLKKPDTATMVMQRATEPEQAVHTEYHTVVKGDTLWAICKKAYGDGNRYKEVAKTNAIKNPNLIYPGQIIKLQAGGGV